MKKLLAKPAAESVLNEVKNRTHSFTQKYNRSPKLVVILVGNNAASVIYTRKKGEMAVSLGMEHQTFSLPEVSTPQAVYSLVQSLNQDASVDGILIQRPLPQGFLEEEVVYWVTPEKDVDAFHPINAGRLFLGLPCFQPCTPAGIMKLLEYYCIPLSGKTACVIGRSSIVGKPMASLLLKANATVLHCHSKTPNIQTLTTQAELLIVAAGKIELIDSSYVRKGAVVIDVGIHKNAQGKVVGDVQLDDVSTKASAITPVPGGVGPMTIAILMQNTIAAAEIRARNSTT